VGTLSFESLPAQKTMEQFFVAPNTHTMPLTFALNSHKPEKNQPADKQKAQNALGQFRLVKVEQISGATDSPEGTYALTIVPHFGPAEAGLLTTARGIFQEAEEFGYFEVEMRFVEGGAKEGDRPHYHAVLKGTSRTHRIWAAQPSLFFGGIPIGEFAAPLGFQLYIVAATVLSIGSWAAVLVGVVITSFFIPNMLRKGTIDLLLVKPIQRWVLLVYKYFGGLIFIFLCTSYALGGIWLVLGIRTGLWANWTLLLILTITFFFAILYAISTFAAVLTRSTVTAIMVTIAAWFAFFLVGTANSAFNNQYVVEEARMKEKAPGPDDEVGWGHGRTAYTVYGIHALTPRTSDLGNLNDLIVFCDFMTGNLNDMNTFDTSKRNWWESVLVSAVWIALFLGLACLWFTFKDY